LTGTNELALITTPIQIFVGETLLGTATGFFFTTADESQSFLITNRRVVIEEKEQKFPDHLVLRLHTSSADLKQSSTYTVPLHREIKASPPHIKEKLWHEVDPTIDVVAIEIKTEDLKPFVLKAFSREHLIPSDVCLSLGDPLVVIGYPLGFSDQIFDLPVAREGTFASVFPIPFQGQRFFLVDARLHPGTSGSPVITRPSNWLVVNGTPKLAQNPVSYLVGVQAGSAGDLQLNAVWFSDIILSLIK